jgi:hypothetical protein
MPSKYPTKAVQRTTGWKNAIRTMQNCGYDTERMDAHLYGPSVTGMDVRSAMRVRQAAVDEYVRIGFTVRELDENCKTVNQLYVDADTHEAAKMAYENATGRSLDCHYSSRLTCAGCKRDRTFSEASSHLTCFVPDAAERYAPIPTGKPRFTVDDSQPSD